MSRNTRQQPQGEQNAHAGRDDRTPPDLGGSAPNPRAVLRGKILEEIGRLVKSCRSKRLAINDLKTLRELIEKRGQFESGRQGTLPLDRAAWQKGADDGNPFA